MIRARYLSVVLSAVLLVPLLFINAQAADTASLSLVKVYYFHGNFRCANCYNMEKWTEEVINTHFKDARDSGKLRFEIINTETAGNEHYNKDYGLYTKSIVLSLAKNGKEVKFENLSKVWDKLRNKDKFCRYIKDGIDRYLKEL